jgi:hypothetical protein
MPWNAILVDGPHEGRTVLVEEEMSNDPPPMVDVDGERYVYSGFSQDTPRYRHEGEAPSSD